MATEQIKIEKIVYPGNGLGRGSDGIATFVDGCLPGETVEVMLTKKKKSFKEGKLVHILQAAPERITPRCPSFGICGGCSLQHASYEHQLAIKKAYVQELLTPLPCPPVSLILPSPDVWHYRNKMEFSFAENETGLFLGLHEKGAFDRHFPVPPCFISDEDFLPIVQIVTEFARQSQLPVYNTRTHEGFYRHLVLRKAKRTNQILINISTNQWESVAINFWKPLLERLDGKVSSLYWTVNANLSDAVMADELILLAGEKNITEQMVIKDKTYMFHISPFSFFQTNTAGAEKLYETALDFLAPDKQDRLLDLYCGTGTIGLVIAPFVEQVLGVEQVPQAIENAEENKKLNRTDNIRFEVGSVEKWIKHGQKPDFNCLVVDPPRSGLSNKVLDFISQTKPAKLVYVSCNPATLARDLQYLNQAGIYTIDKIIAVDMFPHTYHVETVVRLSKK